MKGFLILAVKSPVYGRFAANLAISLKHTTPDIPIQLVYDQEVCMEPQFMRFFDYTTLVDKEFSHLSVNVRGRHHYKFEPAKAKLQVYKLSKFDETVYLDADSLALSDASVLFDWSKDRNFVTQVFDNCDSTCIDFPNMLWGYPQRLWSHYNLPKDGKLPATNTSFMYYNKSSDAALIFDTAYDLLMHRTYPLEYKRMRWGHSQPDELYLNLSLCINHYDAGLVDHPYVMMFARSFVEKPEEIVNEYPFIGIYGGRGAIHNSVLNHYQRLVDKSYLKESIVSKFQIHNLVKKKIQHVTYKEERA